MANFELPNIHPAISEAAHGLIVQKITPFAASVIGKADVFAQFGFRDDLGLLGSPTHVSLLRDKGPRHVSFLLRLDENDTPYAAAGLMYADPEVSIHDTLQLIDDALVRKRVVGEGLRAMSAKPRDAQAETAEPTYHKATPQTIIAMARLAAWTVYRSHREQLIAEGAT